MNRKKIFITSLIILAVATQAVFARDNLDKWLDKYEEFVETVEDAVKNKQTSKIDSFKEQQKKLIAEKDEIQKQDGNFTFSQGTRYAAINSRWGIAIGSLSATKGLKNTTEKLDKFLEENTQDMQGSQNSSEELRSKTA
ncbi:MAG: hypothetical protein ACI4LX_08485 [Treponema sp.]